MSESSQAQGYARGVTLIIIAGVFLSTGGLLVRFVDTADPWLVLFYRSLTFLVTVLVFMLVRDGRGVVAHFRRMRGGDAIITCSLAISFICYLQSLFHTSVANTVLLLCTAPLFAALLGWIVLREAVRAGTWVAMAVASAGITVMVSGGIALSDWIGMLYALVAVFGFAVMVVTIRKIAPGRDTIAASALAGLLAAMLCMPMIDSFVISTRDLVTAMLLGSLQVGAGFILINYGTRSVPAAQVPLFGLAETVLSPVWVWFAFNEQPSRNTLMGGAIVILAVLLLVWFGNAERKLMPAGGKSPAGRS